MRNLLIAALIILVVIRYGLDWCVDAIDGFLKLVDRLIRIISTVTGLRVPEADRERD